MNEHVCDCPILNFDQMVLTAQAITAHPSWTGPQLWFTVENRPGVYGSTIPGSHLVRFARTAPRCTVAEELAHVLEPYSAHGDRWWAEFARLEALRESIPPAW